MRYARDLLLPCIICAVSFAVALAMAIAAGVGGTQILTDYVAAGLIASYLALIAWTFVPRLRAPEHRRLPLVSAPMAVIRQRWMLLLLPTLVLPVFMTGFTVAKASFPFLTGFQWDGFWTEADALLFNGDPWRVTHQLIGRSASSWLALVYFVLWGVVLGMVMPLYTLAAEPRRVIRAFTALMATWFVVGVAGATAFSSAGPIFADLADPALGQHFAPLKRSLAGLLSPGDPILSTQQYLRQVFELREAFRGAGISAMPSMHLGACSFMVILAWNSWWRIPAILFWLLIWIGSVHFGYHYALDGLIAAPLAWICWRMTEPGAQPLSRPARTRLAAAAG